MNERAPAREKVLTKKNVPCSCDFRPVDELVPSLHLRAHTRYSKDGDSAEAASDKPQSTTVYKQQSRGQLLLPNPKFRKIAGNESCKTKVYTSRN
jgi:hypothetical protein